MSTNHTILPDYNPDQPALHLIDPRNDLLVEGGRLLPQVSEVAPAVDLGCITLVRDATAAFSHDGMRGDHDVTGATFAHTILTTTELLSALRRKY